MDVITTHINADFDALASVIAARKLYPEAVIVFPGSMEKRVRDFVDVFQPVEIRRFRDLALDKIKRLVVVDTKHPDRIGPFKEVLTRRGIKVHVYDHHPGSKDDIRGEVEIFENVGAASTIFAGILQKKGIMPTPMEATILCLGIYEETGSLLYASTTPKDLMAVAYLLRRGANLNIVSNFLKVELSKEEFDLLNELLRSIREIVVQGVRIKIAKGTMEGFGDVAHLAHKIMDMEDTDAVVLLIGMADKILIVARSKVPELDVGRVLSVFGGGGHPSAASATIKDIPFEIVEERLLDSVEKHVRPMKVARDVMTAPVVVIAWNSTVKEAEDTMTRYGVTVLPVVRDDVYSGIITREIVEKALFHGFGKSRCIDFATTDATTATPDTPIADVEEAMVEQNQRFIPVVEGDRVTGAITRTDIMRALYEDLLRKSRVTSKDLSRDETLPGFGRNLSTILRDRLPDNVYEILRTAGDAADELGCAAYLVGGFVRDLLRSEENLDIDIVVEQDGITFARNLAGKIGARVTVHHRFGTAKIIRDSFKLDVATARTEYYESPAALPTVEASSIKKDLYRRDFTINTLAVKLNRRDFGQLIDFFGGQRDLKERVIKVLHNLSFVEDPTRAYRAIRFSERFGYKLSKHTENLIKLAVRMNIFEKLSGTRIYDELNLIFHETDPVRAIRRLSDYELLKIIHPRITWTAGLETLLQSVQTTISWFELLYLKESFDRGVLYTMALLHRLTAAEREVALERLGISPKIRGKILSGLQSADSVLRRLKPDDPIRIYDALTGCDLETMLLCMALTQDQEKKKSISQFLTKLRNTRPIIRGSDLAALGIPPGPQYAAIFNGILKEKLLGRLTTKEDELSYVQEHFLPAGRTG